MGQRQRNCAAPAHPTGQLASHWQVESPSVYSFVTIADFFIVFSISAFLRDCRGFEHRRDAEIEHPDRCWTWGPRADRGYRSGPPSARDPTVVRRRPIYDVAADTPLETELVFNGDQMVALVGPDSFV